MTTEVALVNAALRRVGSRAISAIDDTTPGGAIAGDVLAFERDALLRSHVWNFAVTRATLSKLATAPNFEWKYAYGLPSDYLRLVSAHDNDAGGGQLHYKIETISDAGTWKTALLSDSEDAYIRYVRKVTDPASMPPMFHQVLILRLAQVFSTSVANSNTTLQLITEELKAILRQARSIEGIEDYPEQRPEGSWAQSRRGNAWGRGSMWPSG